MAEQSTRIKNKLRENENLVLDVYDSIVELDKLIKYYQSEVKQNLSEIKRLEGTGREDLIAYRKGRYEAYSDHIAEITYIVEILKGAHKDKEQKVEATV